MSETVSRQVTVKNKQGLHARPANALVQMASKFESKIEVVKDAETVDAKSILSVLTLAAVQGTRMEIRATGSDANEAIESLVDLFERQFVAETEDDDTTQS